MSPTKYRWSRVYESSEEELIVLLAAKKITAERWEGDPDEVFEPHVHPHDKQLWCADGTIVFTIDNQAYSLQAGDALKLPANTMHEAVAGFNGCVCYEAPPLADNPSLPAA